MFVCNLSSPLFLATPIEIHNVSQVGSGDLYQLYMLFKNINSHPPSPFLLLVAPIIKEEKKGECVLFVCNLSSALFLAATMEICDVGSLSVLLAIIICYKLFVCTSIFYSTNRGS